MVNQTISYNDKARSTARRGLMKEARNSQRLFFISKELQLNTKFHYIEVTATSENYKITLCISKITVKRKSFFTSAYIPCQDKKTQKNHKKGKGKEKKRECEKEGKKKRRKRRRKRRKGKKRRKKRKKRRKRY